MPLFIFIALLLWAGEPSPEVSRDEPQSFQQENLIRDIRDQLNTAAQLLDKGDISGAREIIVRNRRRADLLGVAEAEKELLLSYSGLYLAEQKFDSARMVTEQGLQLELPDSVKVSYLNQLGTIFRFQSDYIASLKAYTQAYELSQELIDSSSRVGILQNMAVSYKAIGQLDRAIQYFTEALSYARAEEDTTLLIVVTNNIGDTYNDMEQFLKATIYLKESLDLAQKKDYKNEILRATTNLGISQSRLGRNEEALTLFRNALQLNQEVRPGVPPFQIEYNMGQMYLAWGRPDSAYKYFRSSLEDSKQYGISPGIYYNNVGLADLSREKGNNTEALGYLREAYDTALEIGSLNDLRDSARMLYEIYKEDGNEGMALNYFEEMVRAEDSLSTISTAQAVAEMEARLELVRQQTINDRLETEQSRQDALLGNQRIIIIAGGIIVLLVIAGMIHVIRSDRKVAIINRELRKQKEKLEHANKEKDRLFAIIAHDMRSPLTSLQGFIYLLRSSELSKEEIDEISSELEISVQKNLNLMKDLLTWAKEQMTGLKIYLKDVNLRNVTEDVLHSSEFMSIKKQLVVQNNIPDDAVLKADYDALEIIIRNLFVNAVKFTPRGGEIRLDLRRKNGHEIISVTDNGIGIPEEMKDDIFNKFDASRKGTQGEKGSGFGLNLSQQLVKKMGGRLYFDSREGKGSTFYIELKAG